MQPKELPTTLIGDLVASREFGDRSELQRSLEEALQAANSLLDPLQRLETTVGDEFQGIFSSVAAALRASLLLRLDLLERADCDSRYGLGYGGVTVFDATRSPTSQDGPGWWAARQAIDRAGEIAESPRTSFARTCFVCWPDTTDISKFEAAAIDAVLIFRDATVGQMTPRERRLLRGFLTGQSQSDLAAKEGITQSAVSQGLMRSGAYAVEAAQLRLEEDLP